MPSRRSSTEHGQKVKNHQSPYLLSSVGLIALQTHALRSGNVNVATPG